MKKYIVKCHTFEEIDPWFFYVVLDTYFVIGRSVAFVSCPVGGSTPDEPVFTLEDQLQFVDQCHPEQLLVRHPLTSGVQRTVQACRDVASIAGSETDDAVGVPVNRKETGIGTMGSNGDKDMRRLIGIQTM